jgi:hypothetical protein
MISCKRYIHLQTYYSPVASETTRDSLAGPMQTTTYDRKPSSSMPVSLAFHQPGANFARGWVVLLTSRVPLLSRTTWCVSIHRPTRLSTINTSSTTADQKSHTCMCFELETLQQTGRPCKDSHYKYTAPD